MDLTLWCFRCWLFSKGFSRWLYCNNLLYMLNNECQFSSVKVLWLETSKIKSKYRPFLLLTFCFLLGQWQFILVVTCVKQVGEEWLRHHMEKSWQKYQISTEWWYSYYTCIYKWTFQFSKNAYKRSRT
jgi:hypothetical protein